MYLLLHAHRNNFVSTSVPSWRPSRYGYLCLGCSFWQLQVSCLFAFTRGDKVLISPDVWGPEDVVVQDLRGAGVGCLRHQIPEAATFVLTAVGYDDGVDGGHFVWRHDVADQRAVEGDVRRWGSVCCQRQLLTWKGCSALIHIVCVDTIQGVLLYWCLYYENVLISSSNTMLLL